MSDSVVTFLRNWWTLAWLILGVATVAAGIIAGQIKGEAAVLALCVAMILLTRPSGIVLILTGILGAVGALFGIAQLGEVGLFDKHFGLLISLLVGIPSASALMGAVLWHLWSNRSER